MGPIFVLNLKRFPDPQGSGVKDNWDTTQLGWAAEPTFENWLTSVRPEIWSGFYWSTFTLLMLYPVRGRLEAWRAPPPGPPFLFLSEFLYRTEDP